MFGGELRQVSNRADWIENVKLTDSETGEPIDLTTLSNIEIGVVHPAIGPGSGGYGDGSGSNNTAGMTGSLADGKITLIEPGIFQFWFKVDQMRSMPPQTYDFGMTLTSADGLVVQIFICQVSIIEGYVR